MSDLIKNVEIAPDVYEVVASYTQAQAAAPDDLGLVRSWVARYPQFRSELSAASYAQITQGSDWLTEPLSDTEEYDAEIVEIGQRLLSAELSPTMPPVHSLVEAAKAQGLTPKALAETIHLDIPLLAKLEQRGIRVATIPQALVQSIADTLHRSVSDVMAYLIGPPRLPAAAHFRARQAPVVRPEEDFHTALQSAPAEIQAYWQENAE